MGACLTRKIHGKENTKQELGQGNIMHTECHSYNIKCILTKSKAREYGSLACRLTRKPERAIFPENGTHTVNFKVHNAAREPKICEPSKGNLTL